MNTSPREQHLAALRKINAVVTTALQSDNFPGFVEILDRDRIELSLSYDAACFTHNGDYPVYCEAAHLACHNVLVATFDRWNVELAGDSLSRLLNNLLGLRICWARASDYQDDLPNFRMYRGAYIEWASHLNIPELTQAVGIVFSNTTLLSNEIRGRYLKGVCQNKITDKKRGQPIR